MRTDAYMAANGGESCLLPAEQQLYNEATGALDEADEAEATENDYATPVPGTWSGEGNGPEDDPECKELNDTVAAAKDKVSSLGGRCRITDPIAVMELKRLAWLEQAEARSVRDQKRWSGGDLGHQEAQAAAWSNVGRCTDI